MANQTKKRRLIIGFVLFAFSIALAVSSYSYMMNNLFSTDPVAAIIFNMMMFFMVMFFVLGIIMIIVDIFNS